MRIGILETGFPPKEMQDTHGTYGAMFARLLGGHGFAFTDWKVTAGELPGSPSEADGWLITGSRHGVYEDHDWIAPLEAFVRGCVDSKTPIIGICFGHQLMAQALGGKVENTGRWGLGPTDYENLETGGAMKIIAVHQDQVTAQPPGTRIIARSAFCPLAGLEWEGAPAISWQPHPEMSPAFARELVEARRGAVYAPEVADAALARMDEPIDSPALGERMARFFIENAKADATV